MARHRMRREMSSTKREAKSISPTAIIRRQGKWIWFVMGGIAVCTVLAVYFFVAAPEVKKELRDDDTPWHEKKHTWNLRPLSSNQMDIISNSIDMDRLKYEYLPNILIVRKPGTENIVKVKNFIVKTMSDLKWDVEENTFQDHPPKSYSENPITFTNVIATFNPSATRRLILACHYDSKVTPEGFLGAVDSAVPCAMLLEIAQSLKKYMSTSSESNNLTLQLIFFDGEEAFVEWTATDSIFGARHLAGKWESESWPANITSDKNTLHSIDLFVLLDLLGEADPKFYSKIGVDIARHYMGLVRIEKKLRDGKRYFEKRNVSYRIEDDHIPFLQRSVPILHVIPIPFPRNWHKLGDDGSNINYNTVQRLTKIMAIFTAEYLHLNPS